MAPNNTKQGQKQPGAPAAPLRSNPAARKTERPTSGGRRSQRPDLPERTVLISWRQHHRDSLRDALQTPQCRPRQQRHDHSGHRHRPGPARRVWPCCWTMPRAITRGWDGNAHLSVFLDMDISEARQRALAEEWQGTENITRTEVITRAQALAEFKALSGFGDVLEALPDKPASPR